MRRGSARLLSVATVCLLTALLGGPGGVIEVRRAQGDDSNMPTAPAAGAAGAPREGRASPPDQSAPSGAPADAAEQAKAPSSDSEAQPAKAQEPPADKTAADTASAPAASGAAASGAAAPKAQGSPAGAAPASTAAPAGPADASSKANANAATNDAAAALAESDQRLKALGPAGNKDESAHSKALREALEERKRWLAELEKEAKDRAEVEHPAKSPERELSQLKSELERASATLEQAKHTPENLLPASARGKSDRVAPNVLGEIKEAIESAKNELNEASVNLDTFRSDPARKSGGALAGLRAERDKIQQRCASLAAVRSEREAELTAATTAEARELAREHLINFEWESRVEAQRLATQEARISLEAKRSTLEEPQLQLLEARRELAKRTLEALEKRHRVLVERQQGDLAREAAKEAKRADVAYDPLERFRARRNAELLGLRSLVLQDEHSLAAGPSLSLEVEREQADRVVRDFADLKQVVEEGRAPAIVALRLRNDYQHLSIERADIARNELVKAAGEMARIENSLTSVEFDLINHSRDARIALEELLEELPKVRWTRARALAETLAAERHALLTRRRMALEKLAERAQAVHKQVVRRLNTLEDQYNYVRTHIFWMRDTESFGLGTLLQVPRESQRLARSTLRLAGDATDRGQWGRVSPAFALVMLMVLALPWPLHRARVALGRLFDPARPAPVIPEEPPPEPARLD